MALKISKAEVVENSGCDVSGCWLCCEWMEDGLVLVVDVGCDVSGWNGVGGKSLNRSNSYSWNNSFFNFTLGNSPKSDKFSFVMKIEYGEKTQKNTATNGNSI